MGVGEGVKIALIEGNYTVGCAVKEHSRSKGAKERLGINVECKKETLMKQNSCHNGEEMK